MQKCVIELADALRSGEPLVRLSSDEPDNAAKAVETMTEELNLRAAQTGRLVLFEHWNAATGLHSQRGNEKIPRCSDTLALWCESLKEIPANAEDTKKGALRVYLVRNLHLVLAAAPEPTLSWLERFADLAETRLATLVAPMPPGAKLPPEIVNRFYVIHQPLPDAKEIAALVLEKAPGGDRLTETARQKLAEGANGLTRTQVVTACARSAIARASTPYPPDVLADKIAAVNEEGLVQILDTADCAIGGNAGMLELLTALLETRGGKARAKGVLTAGPPGVGKSLGARALGAATGLPVLGIDLGRLMGEFVGNTEANTRKLFDVLDVIAPCVCLLDEVGKVLPGGGDRDGGVGSRLLGSMLTYMNDAKKPVFWYMTANDDVLSLKPEFYRSGRVDLKFWVGLPDQAARASIWKIHANRYFGDVKAWPAAISLMADAARAGGEDFADAGWTGAEIEACCRLTAQLGRSPVEVAKLITPVSVVAKDTIAKMESWASANGVLDAGTGQLLSVAKAEADRVKSRSGRRAITA